MLVQGLIFQGEGSTVPVESHHIPTSAPSTSQPPTSPPSMQITHVVEKADTMPHDSPLPRVYSLGSNGGSMTLHELTVLYTTLSKKVESLESDLKQTKLTYGAAYTKLIMKVKKLENRIKSSKARRRTHGRHEYDLEPDFDFTAPEEVYIAEPDISTANVPVSTAGAEVSTASPEVKTATKSLVYIRRSATKRKDKGKAIMKEAEPVQKKTKLQLEQERFGYKEALRLQEQLDEEERQRIARKLQAEERGKFSEVENARLLVEMINERKRLFAQQRAEQRRNKPMTKAQQRTYMYNYIKNMGSHTLQQLKKLSFDEIKELFETTMKRVKDFVPMESDRLVPKISPGNSKRTAEIELEHEGSKRKKTNEEKSAKEEKELSEEKLQKLMMIVQVEEIYVEALQFKYPIIDWEKFNRDDLDKLWSLVKERFSSTDPTDDKERTLWVELKRLFEPNIDDIMWKLQRYMHDPLTWKLYDTCGVHHVSTDRGHDIFMLVEKDYPLTRGILTLMLCNKLQVDQYSEMANELLKKIFILANRQRQRGLLGIKGFYKFLLLVQLSTAKRRLSSSKLKIQGRHEHDMEFDFNLNAAKDVSTAEKDVSTVMPVSTAGAAVTTASVAVSTAKDKGKAKMDEYEYETAQTKTKLQQEQERLGYKAAVRLQAELEEEERVEADEELAQRLQAEEREMYTEAEQARILVELIN
ncbi:hypothetical protein Tco_0549016 [Tanacetum coccineum]